MTPSMYSSSSGQITQDCLEINNDLETLTNSEGVSSLVAAVIVNDKIRWKKAFGSQADIDAIFPIASVTKTFTSTALFQLEEKGLLKLSDNVNDYLDFELQNPNHLDVNITIEQLLTHTSSLVNDNGLDYDDEPLYVQMVNPTLSPSPLNVTYPDWVPEFYDSDGEFYSVSLWSDRIPGQIVSPYQYSNAGFTLLGYLIERITGLTYINYLKANIFEKLGIDGIHYDYAMLDMAQQPIGYFNNGSEVPVFNSNERGAGSLRATINDLSKFFVMHMNNGSIGNTTILSMESSQKMQSDYNDLLSTRTRSYGYGWQYLERGTEVWTGHSGSIAGFYSQMFYRNIEGNSVGIIILMNKQVSFLSNFRNLLFDGLVDETSWSDCDSEVIITEIEPETTTLHSTPSSQLETTSSSQASETDKESSTNMAISDDSSLVILPFWGLIPIFICYLTMKLYRSRVIKKVG